MRWSGRSPTLPLFLTLALVAGAPALGQGTKSSTIVGYVSDASGDRPLSNTSVVAASPVLDGDRTAVTDSNGEYRFDNAPIGVYRLRVNRDGYAAYESPEVTLHALARLRVNVSLRSGSSRPSPAQRLEFAEGMTAPQFISGPDPEYSEKAIEHEVQGQMIVKCIVTVEGEVRECKALKSLPFMDRAVVDALQHRRYSPAMQDGRPVEVAYTFKLTLKLPSK
jgi:TonB family protein